MLERLTFTLRASYTLQRTTPIGHPGKGQNVMPSVQIIIGLSKGFAKLLGKPRETRFWTGMISDVTSFKDFV